MSSSKLDSSMRNILKALKHDKQSQSSSNEFKYSTNSKRLDDCIKEENNNNNNKIHNTIKSHPLLNTINLKSNKETLIQSSDLFARTKNKEAKLCRESSPFVNKNAKSLNHFEEISKTPEKSKKINKSKYYQMEDEFEILTENDNDLMGQNLRKSESNHSFSNNNHNNNNNYYKPFKLLSRTDCSVNDNNTADEHNFCSNEVKRKFQRANRVFYNGFLNKQDKSSTLPEYQAHAGELLHFLKSLWMTNTMCDLVLVIGNRKYSAHQLGLAMFSRKYRDEFQRQLNNRYTGVYTICLKNTSCSALEAILKYIYTAKIDINPANVEEILEASKELGIDDLICMTKDYLSSLSMGDLLDFMGNVLHKEGYEFLFYELYAYMMTHLDKISRTPEYYKSGLAVVKALLNDSHLAVCSEMEIFEAAIRWINFDKTRQKYLADLMKCIRFTLMTPDELVSKVESQSLLTMNSDTQKMLYNAFKYHALTSVPSNLNKICQKEESRNFCLKGASVPDEFVKAIMELSDIAHRLKEKRNHTTSNLMNCEDNDDFIMHEPKHKNHMKNFNNNNNNESNKQSKFNLDEESIKDNYNDLVKKISKDFNKLNKFNCNESKCNRCLN